MDVSAGLDLELMAERLITQSAQEVMEGISYQSGIGHQNDVDIETIPEPIPHGDYKPLTLHNSMPTIVAFDFETTDLIRGREYPDITQVAACHPDSGKTFNQYILPTVPISSNAEQITGLHMVGEKLFHGGIELQTVEVHQALESFFSWLQQFQNCILVAHNSKRFDFPILVCVCKNIGLVDRLYQSCFGFVDSLPLFKKVYPGRSTYKQEELAKDILNLSYGAHDALEDIKSLGSLTIHSCNILTQSSILDFSFSPKGVLHSFMFNDAKAMNIGSLNDLVAKGICKRPTAENIAGSGLNLHHLSKIFDRDGEDGLRNTFIFKNCEGQPRVTNTTRTLDSVIPKLAEYLKTK